MQDILRLKIPCFQPEYKRWKRYGYTDVTEKENLHKLLEDTTGGYCMYCFSRVKIDGKSHGHLEHAIEKNNSDRLRECIPDIGLACSKCNLTFKRKGEKNRKIAENDVTIFETESKCKKDKRKQCTVACSALRKLQKKYSELPGAEILLQPMNVKANTGNYLQLQYDVLKMQFEPQEEEALTEQEREFVRAHINRFHLNDPKHRTKQLLDFVRITIDSYGKIPNYEYNNLVVQLFAEQLVPKTEEERVKICSKIYPVLVLAG
ncbi:MAG: hypothetical protein J6A77_11335 [Lachnospiraceae bacterium]|nr:hypothetical protein [Lachnospiraceae bacterium]